MYRIILLTLKEITLPVVILFVGILFKDKRFRFESVCITKEALPGDCNVIFF